MKKNLLCFCGLAVLFCLFAFAGSLSAQNTTVNKSETFKVKNGNGDYTWTVPTEMDGLSITVTHIRFEAIGGGGAGGYVYDHKGGEAASGGGGGGAYTYFEVANPQETSYAIHVGKGGTSTASNRSNTNGGASTVSGTNGIILQAAGGKTVVPTNHGTISTNYYTFAGGLGGQVADCIPQENAIAGVTGGDGWYGEWLAALHTRGGVGGNAAGPADLAGNGGATNYQSYIASGGITGKSGSNYGGGGAGAHGYSIRLVGNNIERNGGTGANGVVRVTYAYEIDANAQAEDKTADVCSDMTFELPLDITLTNVAYDGLAFGFNQGLPVSDSVTSVGEFSINENFVLTGKFHNAAKGNKPYVLTVSISTNGEEPAALDTFTVNFNVYAPIKAGALTSNSACGTVTLVMGQATGGSGDYAYTWLKDNVLIEGANGLVYSPSELGSYNISGVANDAVCGTADTVTMLVGYDQDSQPVDPGFIGRNDTVVCPNNTYSTTLYAGTLVSGTVKWQRKYNDNEWRDVISHGIDHGPRSYNVWIFSSQFDTVNTARYRYLIKPTGCENFVPCNDVFVVSKKEFPAYEEQLKPVTVTLPYGECAFNIDSLEVPVLPEAEVDTVYLAEGQEKNLVPSETPYKVIWSVVDVECGAATPDTQLVTVKFPVCGEGFVVEDAENNEYATVRVGCDCWMAENLKTTAENASYFREDASYADFGMLYTLADVFPPVRAIANEDEPIQGICPDGWAVPTLAQYNALMAAAGSVENLKALTGWLPEYAGTNLTGFSAMAPGFYNASADQFQKHQTFAGFWTSTRSEVAGSGMIFEINYNCDNGTLSSAPEANMYSVRCVKVNVVERPW